MAEMTAFQFGGFWDVPRGIALLYRGRLVYMESYFDEELDEYPSIYSVYVYPETVEYPSAESPWAFKDSPATFIGEIPIRDVLFDPSKRKELDATVLDGLFATYKL